MRGDRVVTGKTFTTWNYTR